MTDLNELIRIADALTDAGALLPKHLRTRGEILAVILAGDELGLGPMAAIRGISLVQGKVSLGYDVMVALLRRAGYGVTWLESTAQSATLKLVHPNGDEHVETFDMKRAKAAGLGGRDIWRKYPDAMLRARATSAAARAFAADVLSGCYVPDEVAEIEAPKEDDRGAHEGHAYGRPEHDEPRAAAVQAADAFVAEHLAWLDDAVSRAAAEVGEASEGDEAELEAIRAGHEAAIRSWIELNGPAYLDACNVHPSTSTQKGKVWRRLLNWSSESGNGQTLPGRLLGELAQARKEAAQ